MGVFSTNQNRQMYVATANKSSVASTDAAGTIAVKSNTAKTEMYFNYVGADKTGIFPCRVGEMQGNKI